MVDSGAFPRDGVCLRWQRPEKNGQLFFRHPGDVCHLLADTVAEEVQHLLNCGAGHGEIRVYPATNARPAGASEHGGDETPKPTAGLGFSAFLRHRWPLGSGRFACGSPLGGPESISELRVVSRSNAAGRPPRCNELTRLHTRPLTAFDGRILV